MIGIFDSGIGGLTVVKAVRKVLPNYDLIYFGDTARVPYGNKSAELIKKYALEDAKLLIKRGAKIIIIACNTASAIAREYLREQLELPVLGVIGPAVIAAKEATINGRIGVIGTRATVNSGIYQLVLNNLASQATPTPKENDLNIPAFIRKNRSAAEKDKIKYEIFAQAAPLLVSLVEEGWINRPETKQIIKKYLLPLKQQRIDTLILGCTHYPLLKDIIQSKSTRVKLVDPAQTLAFELVDYLKENKDLDYLLSKRGELQLLVSDLTPYLQTLTKDWLGRNNNLELVEVD